MSQDTKSTQKSMIFVYTSNKYVHTEIRNTIYNHSKILRYNKKYVQDIYIENYKMLMKEIKEDINK